MSSLKILIPKILTALRFMVLSWVWVPNGLTFLRLLALYPVWFFILSENATLFQGFLNNYQSAGFVGFWATLTDVIDGPLARKLNAVTRFGWMFDPFVDKLYIPPFLYIMFRHIPWPVLLLFIICELWTASIALREVRTRSDRKWPNVFGKKSFGFFIGSGVTTLCFVKTPLWPYFQWVAYSALTIGIGLRIGCLYLYHIKKR
jgi:phosphatidylglycerophosphate synthase